MRVLLVTPFLPHPQALNAAPLIMHRQLLWLGARHEVTLATLAGPSATEAAALEGLRSSGSDVHAVWRPELSGARRWGRRLRLAGYWLTSRSPFRNLWFREAEMQRLIERLVSEKAFDLIQVEDVSMGSYRYPPEIPKVLTEHEVRTRLRVETRLLPRVGWLQRALNSEIEQRRWEQHQPLVWRRFSRIQVFTSRDAESIRRLAPDLAPRVRVNPFGVDVPAIVPSREEAATVLFCGGFRHSPNVDAALWLGHDIMPRLRARRPNVRLLVVGSHPPPEVLALGGADDTIVTGAVAAVEPFLERATVVLAPVRTGGGMRMKSLQAMAWGKAVVTTPLGAEGLTAEDEEPALAIAEDAGGLAGVTASLLADPEARRALGSRARAFVAERRTWPAHGLRLDSIHEELRQPGAGAPGDGRA